MTETSFQFHALYKDATWITKSRAHSSDWDERALRFRGSTRISHGTRRGRERDACLIMADNGASATT